jgi:hypothetical protein
MNRYFFWGVVVGVGGSYLFHKFVSNVPGKGQ